MAVKIQFRRDTAANWESTNPILSQGELGLDLTNEKFKIGNGSDNWQTLEYAFFADIATQAEAEAGTATDVLMTPQRTAQAIAEFAPPIDVSTEFSAGVVETRNSDEISFWQGSQAQYDALTQTYVESGSPIADGDRSLGFVPITKSQLSVYWGDFQNFESPAFIYVDGSPQSGVVETYNDANKKLTLTYSDQSIFTVEIYLQGATEKTPGTATITTDVNTYLTNFEVTLKPNPDTIHLITE